jgi:Siphovirus ReqiPepy6 Gp37-like protein
MELMTLNTSFQPDLLVENYASLIWTERYSKYGDFELVSNDIQGIMKLLPRETYVTLRESTVPMVVENHKIQKPIREVPKITVTGRSFETVLERRGSVRTPMDPTSVGVRQAWMMPAVKESDAAFRAMRTVIGDFPQYKGGLQVLPLRNPAVSPNDAIPQISLTLPADYETPPWDSTVTYSPQDTVWVGSTIYAATNLGGNTNKPPASSPTFWTAVSTGNTTGLNASGYPIEITVGDLYNTVMDLITTNYHGLKAVRPKPGNDKVGIEIYNGADLRTTVAFDARFDQFDDATYLLSAQGSSNVAYVYGSNGSQSVLKTTAPEPTGLNRRVLVVDPSTDTSSGSGNNADSRRSLGLIELYKYNVTALVDGQVSEQVGAGFNRDYFLGDIILLVGEYALTSNVRVSEFIRTSDSTGEKAYPAFETVDQ